MKQSEQLKKIMKATNCERYDMNDFYAVCPFTKEELKGKSRLKNVARWRQVGMVWARLSGLGLDESAKMFNRNHSTAIYAEKIVSYSLDKWGDKWIQSIMLDIMDFVTTHPLKTDDTCVNEAVSAVLINNRLSKMV
jgi:hypothetical protein